MLDVLDVLDGATPNAFLDPTRPSRGGSRPAPRSRVEQVRLGGDAFAMLLPETDEDEARVVMARLN